ncbi:MAG: hypothetical protein JKY56_14455 [Kofleriaceae bacterium]|nr:hypothetical protein [Kofleriaceae bacterium]
MTVLLLFLFRVKVTVLLLFVLLLFTFWEWSDKPTKSDLLPKMAKVLGVRIQDLIHSENLTITKRASPVGEVQRVFESVRDLPRSQQRKIIETVDALVEQYQRKKAQ